MLKYFILFVFFISVKMQNLCNLKISDNELSSFRGGSNLIFDDGIINEKWLPTNTFSPHISMGPYDIEYFYAIETHLPNVHSQAHHKIVLNLLINIESYYKIFRF